MKRTLLLFAGVLVCVAVSVAEDKKPKNLIENPSLEDELADNGLPRGWNFTCQPEKNYRFEVVNGGRTGKKSLLLDGKGEWAVVVTGLFPVEAKKQYVARGWVKVEGDAKTEASIKFDYFDADEKYLGQSWPGAVAVGTKDWQPVSHRDHATTFPNAKFVSVTADLIRDGKAWFDDFELVQIDAPKATSNLLINADLEDKVGERPAFWSLSCSEGGKIAGKRLTGQPKAGTNTFHLQGKADWGVAGSEKIELDKKKTYSFSGFARCKTGTVALAFSYWQGEKYLGNTLSDEVTGNERQKRTVVAQPDKYPDATHVAAVIGWHKPDEVEAWFDGLELTAK